MTDEITVGYVHSKPGQRTFPVAEIFGPTIQGEGRLLGAPCYFIRFGGCNYKCSWCDSMHAVDPEQVRQLPNMTAREIVRAVEDLPGYGKWVILSGGNPALQDLESVCLGLRSIGMSLQMETQGTHYKEWMRHVSVITVSPKGPSAQLTQDQYRKQMRLVTDFIEHRRLSNAGPVDLKIPIFSEEDLNFAASYAEAFPSVKLYLSVGNFMEVDTPETLLRKYEWLIGEALKRPVFSEARMHPQMHVLVWGNERGR